MTANVLSALICALLRCTILKSHVELNNCFEMKVTMSIKFILEY